MSTWRAIHFVENQTVENFLEQFKHFKGDEIINWSALGGIFRTALDNPSPDDGKVHIHLPVSCPTSKREVGQFTSLVDFWEKGGSNAL